MRETKRLPVPNDGTKHGHHAAAAAENVAVTNADEVRGFVLLVGRVQHDPFLDRLGHPHHIDRFDRLVRTDRYNFFHTAVDRAAADILRADDIGADGLERRLFAVRHLCQCGSVKDNLNVSHRFCDAIPDTHIAQHEFEFLAVSVPHSHVVLLHFVPTENAYMLGFVVKEFPENLIAKAARHTGYQNGLVADHFRDGLSIAHAEGSVVQCESERRCVDRPR